VRYYLFDESVHVTEFLVFFFENDLHFGVLELGEACEPEFLESGQLLHLRDLVGQFVQQSVDFFCNDFAFNVSQNFVLHLFDVDSQLVDYTVEIREHGRLIERKRIVFPLFELIFSFLPQFHLVGCLFLNVHQFALLGGEVVFKERFEEDAVFGEGVLERLGDLDEVRLAQLHGGEHFEDGQFHGGHVVHAFDEGVDHVQLEFLLLLVFALGLQAGDLSLVGLLVLVHVLDLVIVGDFAQEVDGLVLLHGFLLLELLFQVRLEAKEDVGFGFELQNEFELLLGVVDGVAEQFLVVAEVVLGGANFSQLLGLLLFLELDFEVFQGGLGVAVVGDEFNVNVAHLGFVAHDFLVESVLNVMFVFEEHFLHVLDLLGEVLHHGTVGAGLRETLLVVHLALLEDFLDLVELVELVAGVARLVLGLDLLVGVEPVAQEVGGLLVVFFGPLLVLQLFEHFLAVADVLAQLGGQVVFELLDGVLQDLVKLVQFVADLVVGFGHVEVENAHLAPLQVAQLVLELLVFGHFLDDLADDLTLGVAALVVLFGLHGVVLDGRDGGEGFNVEVHDVSVNLEHVLEVLECILTLLPFVPIVFNAGLERDERLVEPLVLGEYFGDRVELVDVLVAEVNLRVEVHADAGFEQFLEFVQGVHARVFDQGLEFVFELVPVGVERHALLLEGQRDFEEARVRVAGVALVQNLVVYFIHERAEHLQEALLDAAAQHVLDELQEVEQHLVVFQRENVHDFLEVFFLVDVDQGFGFAVFGPGVVFLLGGAAFDNFAKFDENVADLDDHGLFPLVDKFVQLGLLHLVDERVDPELIFGGVHLVVEDVVHLETLDFALDFHERAGLAGLGQEEAVHEGAALKQLHFPADLVVDADQNLAQELVLELVYFSQLVEHGALAHPLGEGQELRELLVLLGFILLVSDDAVHVYHELVPLGLLLLLEPVGRHDQVLGSVFPNLRGYLLVVLLFTQHKFNGVVQPIAREERNSILPGTDVALLVLDCTLLFDELVAVLEQGVLVAQSVDHSDARVDGGQGVGTLVEPARPRVVHLTVVLLRVCFVVHLVLLVDLHGRQLVQ